MDQPIDIVLMVVVYGVVTFQLQGVEPRGEWVEVIPIPGPCRVIDRPKWKCEVRKYREKDRYVCQAQ